MYFDDSLEILSAEFSSEYQGLIQQFEDILVDCNVAMRKTKDPEILRQLYTEASSIFEKFKAFCYQAGPGGQKYFDDMWMHCHNSKNPDFCFLDPMRERMEKYSS